MQDHPFTTVLGLWGTIMVGSLAHLYRKQVPTQLKIIRE